MAFFLGGRGHGWASSTCLPHGLASRCAPARTAAALVALRPHSQPPPHPPRPPHVSTPEQRAAVAAQGARLAALAVRGDGKGYTGHLKDVAWRFVVIEEPSINACALPCGKIVVHSGLVDRFAGDDDALAFVIAHEIGHVTARHSAEQLTMAAATQLVAVCAQSAALAAGTAPMGRKEAEGMEHLLEMGLFRPRSREQEFEADAIGVELCRRAGYGDGRGALEVFACFDEMTKQSLGPFQGMEKAFSWLNTHPTPGERAGAVRKGNLLAIKASAMAA